LLDRYASESRRDSYQILTAREAGTMVGFAAVRRPKVASDPRLRGLRVATLSDIVVPPERTDIVLALLAAAEHIAQSAEADAVLCTSADPRLIALLKRQAYMPASANIHFFLRDRAGLAQWPIELQSWCLARGDGESDEVF